MLKNSTRLAGLTAGLIIGGIGAYIIGFRDETMIIGMIVGGAIGYFIPLTTFNSSRTHKTIEHDVKIPVREEQLDIKTEKVKTADVDIHKEIVNEEETVSIPVSREELVIENKSFGEDRNNETIHIPLRKERIKIEKEPVQLNEVSIYENQIDDTEIVEEILKKEIVTVDRDGDTKKNDERK